MNGGKSHRGFNPVNFLEAVLIPAIVAGYGMVVGWLLSGLEIKADITVETSLFRELDALSKLAPQQVSYPKSTVPDFTTSEIFYNLLSVTSSDLQNRSREAINFFSSLCKYHEMYKDTDFCKSFMEFYERTERKGGVAG